MNDRSINYETKQNVYKRANGCCEYCLSQARYSTQSFSIDHIIPVSKGGNSNFDNLALSCQGCNNHKYNKTTSFDPLSNEDTELFNPRINKWNEHFHWSYDYTQIIGITKIGRATVESLKLNREGLVNLRKILFKEGEHPPSTVINNY
jgi:hypothetical protein